MYKVPLTPYTRLRARQFAELRAEGHDLPCSIVESGQPYEFTKKDRRNAILLSGRMIPIQHIREYIVRSAKRGRPPKEAL